MNVYVQLMRTWTVKHYGAPILCGLVVCFVILKIKKWGSEWILSSGGLKTEKGGLPRTFCVKWRAGTFWTFPSKLFLNKAVINKNRFLIDEFNWKFKRAEIVADCQGSFLSKNTPPSGRYPVYSLVTPPVRDSCTQLLRGHWSFDSVCLDIFKTKKKTKKN